MVKKQEQVRVDVYNSQGVKTMDARGLYDFDELSVEMIKALAHQQIPVVRRAGTNEPVEDNDESVQTEEIEETEMELDPFVTIKWRFDGVEFSAEGPAEYVLRASAELLEYLEALT